MWRKLLNAIKENPKITAGEIQKISESSSKGDINGFSRTNIFAMRKFYPFYKESELVQQAGGKLQRRQQFNLY